MQLWDNAQAMRRLMRWLYALVALCLIGALVMWAKDSPVFAVRRVQINGEVTHETPARLRALAQQRLNANIFQVDINRIQGAFEALPWIKSAQVHRLWPSTVVIDLVEHTPVAVWNGQALVDTEGGVFAAPPIAGLPKFAGPTGSEQTVLRMHERIAPVLASEHLALDQLVYSERGDWRIRLQQGPELKLGRKDTLERLQRLMKVWKTTIAAQKDAIEVIDLRYQDGFAVRPLKDNADVQAASMASASAPKPAMATAKKSVPRKAGHVGAARAPQED